METDSKQPIKKCTLCYKQVHHVCLSNDEQAASIPVCRACASNPDPDRTDLEIAEPPVLPDEGSRREEPERTPFELPSLDVSGVVHGLLMVWIISLGILHANSARRPSDHFIGT